MFLYLDSFNPSFAEVLFNFHIDLNIAGIAVSRIAETDHEIHIKPQEAATLVMINCNTT